MKKISSVWALAASCCSFHQRHGRRSVSVVVLGVLTLVGFARPMGSFGMDMFLFLAALGTIGYSVYSILWGNGNED